MLARVSIARAPWAIGAVAAFATGSAAAGCNALIGIDDVTLGSKGGGGSSASTSSSGGAGASSSSSSTSSSSGCPHQEKMCSGGCVPTDAQHGCATADCAPCDMPHAEPKCDPSGSCTIGKCTSPFADCNHDPSDGCEVDFSSPDTCGSCTTPCPTADPYCAPMSGSYACVDHCPPDTPDLCSGTCVNKTTDTEDCGSCGHDCSLPPPASGFCASGMCDFSCMGTTHKCGMECADDYATDTCGSSCTPCSTAGNHVAGSTCDGTSCGVTCDAGWLHCAGDGALSCDTHGDADDKNCGACGHDCLGGACTAGQCQPIVLAQNRAYASSIALDAVNVYWVDFHSPYAVGAVPKVGGAAASIVTGANVTQPLNVATDGVEVFWTNGVGVGTVFEATTTGTGQTNLGATDAAFGLAAGGGFVFWTNRSGTSVVSKVKISNGALSDVATQAGSSASANGIATDGTTIYWADSALGSIFKSQVAAAPCTLPNNCQAAWATAVNPYAVAVDANNVYWSELAGSHAIFKVSKGGGAAVQLASTSGSAQSIASDGTNLYWGDFGDQSVRTVSVNASSPCDVSGSNACTILPQSQSLGSFPDGVAVDATAIYWTDQAGPNGGVVVKLAK